MTHSEIEQAAMKQQSVVARIRNSTEIMEIVGKVTGIATVFGPRGKQIPVVTIEHTGFHSAYRVAPEDVIRVVGQKVDAVRKESEIEYVNLGRINNGDAFRILATRNGLRVASYTGYMHEVEDKMMCYIKEVFGGAEGIENKVEIPFSEFRRGGTRYVV
jgi:hypothetical protein